MDGTNKIDETYVIYNEPMGELLNITKTGFTFQGWTTSTGDTITETSVNTSRKDIVLYANWISVVSTLNVDPNGGTWEGSIGEKTFALEFKEEKEISDPTRIGYDFVGWEVIGAGSSLNGTTFTMGSENAHLEAKWRAKQYEITINPESGLYNGSSSIVKQTMDYDSTITLSTPTRVGHTFLGWSVSNGTLSGQTFKLTHAGKVTITANWRINSYKYIVYHSKLSVDGTAYNHVVEDTLSGEANYGTVISPPVKTYTGFTSPSSQNMTIEVDSNPPVHNVLDFLYERNQYTLSINPNTGSWNGYTTTQNMSLYYEQTYNITNPTKTGYNFAGWDKTINTSTITDTIFKMGLSNTTLTAMWEAKNFLLQFNVNGGNVLTPNKKQITYDSPYGTLPIPTRVGYEFMGWYTSASGGTRVTASTVHRTEGNVMIYAQWQNLDPEIDSVEVKYTNSGLTGTLSSPSNGKIISNSETATLEVDAIDNEDGTPSVSVSCYSGTLCTNGYMTITASTSTKWNLRFSKYGTGVIMVTLSDLGGNTINQPVVVTVHGEGKNVLNTASFTNTTFDSGWIIAPEGCYVKSFTFNVKFSSGHSNGSSTDPDRMTVTGRTVSGDEVTLFTWSGNMQSTKHSSNTNILIGLTEKVVDIKFYTYSPHDGCARTATIDYSVEHAFNTDLLE